MRCNTLWLPHRNFDLSQHCLVQSIRSVELGNCASQDLMDLLSCVDGARLFQARETHVEWVDNFCKREEGPFKVLPAHERSLAVVSVAPPARCRLMRLRRSCHTCHMADELQHSCFVSST